MVQLLEILTIFLSSLVTVGLSYLRFSVTVYQQIVVLLMVGSLIVFGKLLPGNKQPTKNRLGWLLITYSILFVSSLFVQILVVSTGGFYSPFLVLFHFYILGLSFLLSLRGSISFLIFGLGALGFDLYLNREHLALLLSDPGTALIYITSFVVIIPFAHFIASKYHVKDEIAKILTKQVKVGESILESLSELVVVTDLQFRIVSVNEALKKTLNIDDSEIAGKSLFDILTLKDINGAAANLQSLSIDRVMIEKTSRIIRGFFLYIPNQTLPHRVTIQARPIIDSNNMLDKLTFVINESDRMSSVDDSSHSDLEKTLLLEQQRFQQLKNDIKTASFAKLNAEIELIKKIEEDINLARELEDHSIKQTSKLVDVALLASMTVTSKQSLAKSLGVGLELKLPGDNVKERSLVSLSNLGLVSDLPVSEFSVLIDAKWLGIMIGKLCDLAILISSNKGTNIILTVNHFSGAEINLAIYFDGPISLVGEESSLYNRNYEGLKTITNLRIGSGLEGYIAKSISTQLNLPVLLQVENNLSKLAFVLRLSRLSR